MYVTRRLLRSTLEETAKPEAADPPFSPRRRRPLVDTHSTTAESNAVSSKKPKSDMPTKSGSKSNGRQEEKQAENQGDKKNNKNAVASTVPMRGLGMLIDARDSSDRWCEAKILKLDPAQKRVFIHFVGWNSRYDSWLDVECVAAHGANTGASKKAGSSWNGKDSLFTDPSVREPKSSRVKKEPQSITVVTVSDTEKKRGRASTRKQSGTALIEAKSPSHKKMKKEPPTAGGELASKRAKPPAIQVRVDAVDEESERKSRRGRKAKVDLELEMDVRGEAPTSSKSIKGETDKAKAVKKTAVSPKVKTPTNLAKSPTRQQPARRAASPRTPQTPAKEELKTKELKALSPTVGMSVLRRSSRAAATKKRKKTEEESDEDYVDDGVAEEEEEEDEVDEDGEEEEEEEEEERPRARRGAQPSTSKTGAYRPRERESGPITHWQIDPAYGSTREKLASIFRQRLLQRGQLPSPTFQGSFQHAMLAGGARGRTTASKPVRPSKKQKKQKTTKSDKGSSAEEEEEEEEAEEEEEEGGEEDEEEDPEAEAVAAAYYYAQHQYHMQAYQYHQYMYHQAMLAHQAQLQAEEAAAGTKKDGDTEAKEREEPREKTTASSTDEPVMTGGIIDPRFIHARMEALEQQRRIHEQLYLQHYHQSTERNLQMLASSPEILRHGAKMWHDQVANDYQPPEKSEDKPATADANGKNEESRVVETTTVTTSAQQSPHKTSPAASATPSPAKSTASAKVSNPSTPPPGASPATSHGDATPETKTEAVLFEMVL